LAKSISKNTISDFTGQHLSELAQFGKTYLFDTVSSTQEIAKGLVNKKEPALVIALAQTRGRGRFNRDWYSEKGGLHFSYLYFPDFSVKHKTYQLTLFTGLTIAQSLEKLINKKIDIRWPNDLILAGKKIGGILCETKGDSLIIGIGLNLNQTFFPASLPEATSLFIETNQEFEGGKMLKTLLTALTSSYQDFALNKFTDFLPEIKKRQVLINQRVRVNLWLRRIEGSVIDMDDEGRLLLRTDPGRLITITAGKVHRIANV
jgi:BirA family transcriptional regulator, biotin operon repressor / biotin---[acetyl-CoA-carboxylase] ligase